MSQLGLGMAHDDAPSGSRPPRGRRSGARALVVSLVALLVLALGAALGVRALTGSPADYEGDGSGSVTVVVAKGDSLSQIGRTLASAGVVADGGVFVDAATSDPRGQSIAPGTYTLREHMSAQAALTLMLDPASRQVHRLVIPEGWRLEKILAAASKATGLPVSALRDSVSRASTLGLPSYAEGRAEGFLFPATYEFSPGTTADQVVQAMIQRFDQAAADADLVNAARAVGRTPLEVVTVASILEIEAGPSDYAKVARVLYNRLAAGMPLQLDSTVNYAVGSTSLHLTAEQLSTDSPYNTYLHEGLPPGPIGSPGDAALQAALNPAPGPWLYFVATDPATKTTEFATTYDQFLALKRKFQASAG